MKECMEARKRILLDTYQSTGPIFKIKDFCHKDIFTDTQFNIILHVEINPAAYNIDFIKQKINLFDCNGVFLIYAYYEDNELVSISLDYVNDGDFSLIYSSSHGEDFNIVKEYCKGYVEVEVEDN